MSLDKYRRARKRATWTDESTGQVFTLEEATGRDGIKLLDLSMASAKAGANTIDGAGMVPFFVEAIAVSVVDDDGSRPLNSPEGREVIQSWPLGMLLELGQVAIDLQGLGGARKN